MKNGHASSLSSPFEIQMWAIVAIEKHRWPNGAPQSRRFNHREFDLHFCSAQPWESIQFSLCDSLARAHSIRTRCKCSCNFSPSDNHRLCQMANQIQNQFIISSAWIIAIFRRSRSARELRQRWSIEAIQLKFVSTRPCHSHVLIESNKHENYLLFLLLLLHSTCRIHSHYSWRSTPHHNCVRVWISSGDCEHFQFNR